MKKIQKLVQYTLPIVLALVLLRYAYQGLALDRLASELQEARLGWIALSVLINIASHLLRAYRWSLLLQATGFQAPVAKTFIALMVGHFINLFIPRLGELVRCSVLKRIEGIPVGNSLGTVVTERAVDLLSLLAVVGFAFAIEFKQLSSILYQITTENIPQIVVKTLSFLAIVLLLVLLGSLLLLIGRRDMSSKDKNAFLAKIQGFIRGLLKGLGSVGTMQAKKEFAWVTILMWALYYLIGYVGIFAIVATSKLGWMAGLAILVMGSISMLIPVQGGIGAYHLLISSTLLAYGTSKEGGMLYATLMHAAQLLATFFIGGVSAILSTLLSRKQASMHHQHKQ